MSYFEDQEDLHDEGLCDGAPGCHICQALEDYKAEQKKPKATPKKSRNKKEK